jgi:hypothetical protein
MEFQQQHEQIHVLKCAAFTECATTESVCSSAANFAGKPESAPPVRPNVGKPEICLMLISCMPGEVLYRRNVELTEMLVREARQHPKYSATESMRHAPTASHYSPTVDSQYSSPLEQAAAGAFASPSWITRQPAAAEPAAADCSVGQQVIWVDNLDRLKRRSTVVSILDRLGVRGVQVQFVPSTDACITQVASGGVRAVVTNIGRTRADSGLILLAQLCRCGFSGQIFVYSRSANADPQLARTCIERGAAAVLSADDAEDAIVAAVIR